VDDWTQWRAKIDLDEYDARWARLAAEGGNPHGEVDLVMRFAPTSVLDAGCGTGRVGIELAARGVDVVGVDLDDDLLSRARAKAPHVEWVHGDLAELDLGRVFDLVVLAGNVIPYVAADARAQAVAGAARHARAGGRVIAGFTLRAGWPTLADYDEWSEAAGLEAEARFATWDGARYDGGDYAVTISTRSAHR
jgi:SAM-dependent methyltransferase